MAIYSWFTHDKLWFSIVLCYSLPESTVFKTTWRFCDGHADCKHGKKRHDNHPYLIIFNPYWSIMKYTYLYHIYIYIYICISLYIYSISYIIICLLYALCCYLCMMWFVMSCWVVSRYVMCSDYLLSYYGVWCSACRQSYAYRIQIKTKSLQL